MISMITDMRQKPINSFCCTTTFANLGFFAKGFVPVQLIISCFDQETIEYIIPCFD